ncbi:hypothetical protein VPH35_092918 [Triticum aestivum]
MMHDDFRSTVKWKAGGRFLKWQRRQYGHETRVMTVENVRICSLNSKKVKQFFHFVCFALDIYGNWTYICRSDLFLQREQRCPLHNGQGHNCQLDIFRFNHLFCLLPSLLLFLSYIFFFKVLLQSFVLDMHIPY